MAKHKIMKATIEETFAVLDGINKVDTAPRIEQIDWFNDHWYIIYNENKEPVFIPSVTSKLNASPKPFLARWRGDVGNREADLKMRDAQNKGKRIHNAWFIFNTGGWVLYNPWDRPTYTEEEIEEMKALCNGMAILTEQEEMLAIHKLQRWTQEVKPKFIESEKKVFSLESWNAGTLDNLLFIEQGEYNVNGVTPIRIDKSGYYVFDLKTGNSIDEDDAPAQAAIYGALYTEMTGFQIEGTLIVHTNAKTKKGIEGLATLFRNKEEMKEDLDYFYLVAQVWDKKMSKEKPKFFQFPSLIKLEQ